MSFSTPSIASRSFLTCAAGSALRASFSNFSTISASDANFFSLPRAASTVRFMTVPSLRCASTRTLWRNLRAQRRDLGVVVHLHLLGELHARRVGDLVLGELVHEAVAVEEPGGDAVGEVELGGGQALRHVLPADVVHGDLRAAHDDLLHVLRAEAALLLHVADGIEGGVVGADAGVELERDAHRLPGRAQPGGELLQVEMVVRLREAWCRSRRTRFRGR